MKNKFVLFLAGLISGIIGQIIFGQVVFWSAIVLLLVVGVLYSRVQKSDKK